MNSEDKFWATFLGVCGVLVVAIIVSVAACKIYEVKAIKQMVVSGADPISAACSVRTMRADICGAQAVLVAK